MEQIETKALAIPVLFAELTHLVELATKIPYPHDEMRKLRDENLIRRAEIENLRAQVEEYRKALEEIRRLINAV